MAAAMKFAFLMGKAPADFASMASKLYPIVVNAPLIRPFGLTATQFIFLLATFEMVAAIGFFFNNRIPALMVVAVMAGAEYIGFSQAENKHMPASPVCGTEATCMGSHMFHLALVIMAGMSYMATAPICRAWSKCACGSWFGMKSSKGSTTPEVRTPSRPRRAAAMKNKKNE
jgi:hypothetical protein